MNIERIKQLFTTLKQGNTHWMRGDKALKDRIEKALTPTINELVTLGVARHFSEALLFFGMEFLQTEYEGSNDRTSPSTADVEAVFGVKSQVTTKEDAQVIEILEKKQKAMMVAK